MKKTIIVLLTSLLVLLALTNCSSNNPDEAGLTNLCDGQAIEGAASYDPNNGEQMVAVYVKGESAPYSPAKISTTYMPDNLKDFVLVHFVNKEDEYPQASLVLCATPVETRDVMSCGFKDEKGDEIIIDYATTLYDVKLFEAQTGKLLEAKQIELGYQDETCPTGEVIKNSQKRFTTELSTRYTSQPKGDTVLFWAKTADFLTSYVQP